MMGDRHRRSSSVDSIIRPKTRITVTVVEERVTENASEEENITSLMPVDGDGCECAELYYEPDEEDTDTDDGSEVAEEDENDTSVGVPTEQGDEGDLNGVNQDQKDLAEKVEDENKILFPDIDGNCKCMKRNSSGNLVHRINCFTFCIFGKKTTTAQ